MKRRSTTNSLSAVTRQGSIVVSLCPQGDTHFAGPPLGVDSNLCPFLEESMLCKFPDTCNRCLIRAEAQVKANDELIDRSEAGR